MFSRPERVRDGARACVVHGPRRRRPARRQCSREAGNAVAVSTAAATDCAGDSHMFNGECVPSVPNGEQLFRSNAPPQVATSQLGAAVEYTYQWSWDIPAHHYLLRPEFTCSSNAPWVKGGSSYHTYGGVLQSSCR